MIYPVEKASTVPGSGSGIYLYLLQNISTPGSLPHTVWYNGEKAKLEHPEKYPFRGFFPVGETLKVEYGGSGFRDYTFTGEEQNAVFVKDLSKEARLKLGISADASDGEKVFNPNFLKYADVSDNTKTQNELPTLSLAKSISDWLCQKIGLYYTEQHVVEFLEIAIHNASSNEMMLILHGNHIAWCTNRYVIEGKILPDIEKQFYAQDSPDFYIKDLGTIMPSILYTLTMLGKNPMTVIEKLTFDLYGIKDVALSLEPLLEINQKQKVENI